MATRAKHPKKADPGKPKILIFGAPGVGKTWGALDFPKVYYIDCEGGAALDHYTDKLEASGGVYLGPADGANDFDVVLDEIRTLATSKHSYLTLVIDSYSKLFNTRIAEKYETMEQSGSDMDKTFSREKKPAIARTRQMIAWFDRLDMNVILICHEKDVWSDGKVTGKTFDGWSDLEYELHLALQILKQGTSRKAKVTKNRLKQFREGEVIEWSYRAFAERYGAGIMEAKSEPVAPSSAEQIRVITELASLTKLDDDLRNKWFEAAGVTTWGEFDGERLQKCIDYLTAKLPKSAAVA